MLPDVGFTMENNFSLYSLQAKTNGKFLQKRETFCVMLGTLCQNLGEPICHL